MLILVPSPAAYLRIRASGRLAADDYRRFEPAFAAELERREVAAQPVWDRGAQRVWETGEHSGGEHVTPIALLLDMRGFRGWTPRGFLRDLAWDLKNRRTFSRIAVIGDAPWHRLITALGRRLFRAPMKFFRPHEERDAEGWLGGRSSFI